MSIMVGRNEGAQGKICGMAHTQSQLNQHPLNGVSGCVELNTLELDT